jgi:hypothetical protein
VFPNDDNDVNAAEMSRMEAGNAEDGQSGGERQQPLVHNETSVKPIQNIKNSSLSYEFSQFGLIHKQAIRTIQSYT